jgi:hypothetical protein
MTKLPKQAKKTDYILDPNVELEEQLQRTLHHEVIKGPTAQIPDILKSGVFQKVSKLTKVGN